MNKSEVTIVNCPCCGIKVIWNEGSPYRPFCSKRCQLIDLGEWAAEEKVIQGSPLLSDTETWSEDPENLDRH